MNTVESLTNDELLKSIGTLERIVEGDRTFDVGLCYHLEDVIGPDATKLLMNMTVRWYYFSGNVKFPIGAESDAVHTYHTTRDKYSGEYGRQRLGLALWLIIELKSILEERKDEPTIIYQPAAKGTEPRDS